MMRHLEADINHPAYSQVIYILDGNAMLQAMAGLPGTFEELAQKLFEGLPKCKRVDFVMEHKEEPLTHS